MMGDIHHFAWRALHRNQTVYLDARDAQRFGGWRSEDCDVRPQLSDALAAPCHLCSSIYPSCAAHAWGV